MKSIQLHFDPLEDPATARVFADDVARTLYLLWRRGHMVGDGFPDRVFRIARQIKKSLPQTASELAKCFIWEVRAGTDFTQSDVDKFCTDAIPFFIGEKIITYTQGGHNDSSHGQDGRY